MLDGKDCRKDIVLIFLCWNGSNSASSEWKLGTAGLQLFFCTWLLTYSIIWIFCQSNSLCLAGFSPLTAIIMISNSNELPTIHQLMITSRKPKLANLMKPFHLSLNYKVLKSLSCPSQLLEPLVNVLKRYWDFEIYYLTWQLKSIRAFPLIKNSPQGGVRQSHTTLMKIIWE